MVLVKEYRIVMPMTLEEYNIGQLYTVAKASRDQSGESLAIEILKNEPFENEKGRGQFTHKIFHIEGKLPKIVQRLFPASATKLDERAWNAFPYCRTELTNNLLGDRFEIAVESIYLPNDRGTTKNALRLSEDALKKRQVEYLDIALDQVDDQDFLSSYDPRTFRALKANKGPFRDGWLDEYDGPVMCCYKLVTIKFHVFGFENRIQQFIDRAQRNLFLRINKQIICTIDEWMDLSVDDVRDIENEVKNTLKHKLQHKQLEHSIEETFREEEESFYDADGCD